MLVYPGVLIIIVVVAIVEVSDQRTTKQRYNDDAKASIERGKFGVELTTQRVLHFLKEVSFRQPFHRATLRVSVDQENCGTNTHEGIGYGQTVISSL